MKNRAQNAIPKSLLRTPSKALMLIDSPASARLLTCNLSEFATRELRRRVCVDPVHNAIRLGPGVVETLRCS